MSKRILVLVFSCAVAGAVVAPRAALAEPPVRELGDKPTPKVSLAQARKAALARVPGKVLKEEYEKEDGRWIYSFDIRPKAGPKHLIKEVHVDPDSGKVIAVETERAHDRDGDDEDD